MNASLEILRVKYKEDSNGYVEVYQCLKIFSIEVVKRKSM